MFYKVLADLTVLIHMFWILFLIFGGICGTRNKTIRIFHISGLAFAFVIQVAGWFCPLTYLEVWLRARHDPSVAYSGSFIIHYVEKLIYIEISPRVIIILTLSLCAFNAWLYLRKR